MFVRVATRVNKPLRACGELNENALQINSYRGVRCNRVERELAVSIDYVLAIVILLQIEVALEQEIANTLLNRD